MNNDTDVLEFDFPDYEEPYPPFPDVKVAPFDKEDSYSRNRDIADRLYADELKEKERRAKKFRNAERKKRKRASGTKKHPLKRISSIIALFLAVEAAMLFLSVGIPLIEDGFEPVSVNTEHPRAIIGKNTYVAPDPLPEPFEWVDSGAVTYSNDKMSFMFKPANIAVSDTSAAFDVTVRNLTNEELYIMTDSFYLSTMSGTVNKHTIYYSPAQELLHTLNSNYSYPDPIALGFDSSGECRFTLSFDLGDIDGYDRYTGTLRVVYDRELSLAEYVENTSDTFDVYLKDLYYLNR